MGLRYSTFAPTSAGDQTTTDAYADVFVAGSSVPSSPDRVTQGAVWDVRHFMRWTLIIKNTAGSNGLTYQVLGSVEGSKPTDFVASLGTANVAANASAVVKGSDYYTFIKVQVKAQSAGNQTTCNVKGATAEA